MPLLILSVQADRLLTALKILKAAINPQAHQMQVKALMQYLRCSNCQNRLTGELARTSVQLQDPEKLKCQVKFFHEEIPAHLYQKGFSLQLLYLKD